MSIGLLGKKVGMTQYFNEDGTVVPVTVIEAGPCQIVQVKTTESRDVAKIDRNNRKYIVKRTDGYNAIQMGFSTVKERLLNKPLAGHFGLTSKSKQMGKKSLTPQRFLREFRIADPTSYKPGDEITVAIFEIGEKVKVIGVTKGRGFAGVMKRHHMKGFKSSHGTHECFRHGGSIGMHTWPGRVWKNMKMAGHLGNHRVTVRNLKIVKVDAKRNLLYFHGAIPGPNDGLIEIRKLK